MRSWRASVALLLMAAVASTCTTSHRAKSPAHPPTAGRTAADTASSEPGGGPSAAPTPAGVESVPETVGLKPDATFDRAVRPILEKQCRPCHFEGGVMHEKLPFDRAETIRTLGERLFTRIKDPGERESIRAFLRER